MNIRVYACVCITDKEENLTPKVACGCVCLRCLFVCVQQGADYLYVDSLSAFESDDSLPLDSDDDSESDELEDALRRLDGSKRENYY